MLSAWSCSSSKKSHQEDSSGFLIQKITFINSWNVIYAQKQDSLCMIVTRKIEPPYDCEQIVVGKRYDLDVKSRRRNIPIIGGVALKPVNHLDVESSVYDKNGVECYSYDDETEICTNPDENIHDLYFTDDLIGLCYEKTSSR